MSNVMGSPSSYDLDNHGLRNLNMQYWTLTTPALVERIVSRREGMIAHEGAVVVRTGNHTGRAANDKFIVQSGEAAEKGELGQDQQAHLARRTSRSFTCACPLTSRGGISSYKTPPWSPIRNTACPSAW